jgi:riboflavin synthase alpha subunit
MYDQSIAIRMDDDVDHLSRKDRVAQSGMCLRVLGEHLNPHQFNVVRLFHDYESSLAEIMAVAMVAMQGVCIACDVSVPEEFAVHVAMKTTERICGDDQSAWAAAMDVSQSTVSRREKVLRRELKRDYYRAKDCLRPVFLEKGWVA